jgi:hypothetical protein
VMAGASVSLAWRAEEDERFLFFFWNDAVRMLKGHLCFGPWGFEIVVRKTPG